MIDVQLRRACFWISAFASVVALASIPFASVRPILFPGTIFVGGAAVLLFLKLLFTRRYRRGVEAANREIQGNAPWPGRRRKLSDPEWGLFGVRGGSAALLWLRAMLVLGVLPSVLLGAEFAGLWLASAFVTMELSLMHIALSQPVGDDAPLGERA